MLEKSLKQLLRSGQKALGSWITLGHPAVAEIMARAGFDWLAIDLEHSVITIREAEELIRIVSLCGVVPLVRLTSNNPDLIKRVMDAGAHGVIVPMVNSRSDAERAVSAVYYPPVGKRGVGLARAQGYGCSFAEYKKWLDKEPIIIAQVEHIESVRNLEAILGVEQIDGFIIGPYDLSASMGIPGQFERPEVAEALAEIKRVHKKMGKPGGMHVVEPRPDELKRFFSEGYTFMAYSLDIRMLDVACRDGLHNGGKL